MELISIYWRQVNNGGYQKVYEGNKLNYTDTIASGWSSVRYRIQAMDTYSDNYNGKSTTPTYYITKNEKPTMSIDNPNKSQIIGQNGTIELTGTVTDSDTQTLTVSATIGGKTKSTTIQAPAVNKRWTLRWTGAELGSGKYSPIVVNTTDGVVTTNISNTGNIVVDKVKPELRIQRNKNSLNGR